jgi:hypothetical protein
MPIRISQLANADALTGNENAPLSQYPLAVGGTRKATLTTLGTWTLQTFAGFLPSSTGAVPLPVQTVLRQLAIYPEYFEAAGDGVTDDSIALAKWMAAITGNIGALTPGKTYLHSSNLSIGAGTTIVAYGGTIKAANGTSNDVRGITGTNIDGVRILGLTYDGNRANRAPAANHRSSGIEMMGWTNFLLRDVTVKNSCFDGFIVMYSGDGSTDTRSKNGEIRNCRATNSYRNGLSVAGGFNIDVLGGSYDTTNGTAPQDGIDIEQDTAACANQNVMVVLASAYSNTGSGINATPSADSHSNNISIEQCHAYSNTADGITTGANGAYRIFGGRIVGNNCYSNTGQGINLTGSYFQEIAGNWVYSNTGGGITDSASGANDYCDIHDNRVYSSLGNSIRMGGNYNKIDDNICLDNNNPTGWQLDVQGAYNEANGNVLLNTGTPTPSFGMRVDGCRKFSDNTVVGNQTVGGLQIVDASTSMFHSNNFDGTLTRTIEKVPVTSTQNPGTVNTGSFWASTSIAVTGVVFGDVVTVSPPYDMQGCIASCTVVSTGNLQLVIVNMSGSNKTFGSANWTFTVWKAA